MTNFIQETWNSLLPEIQSTVDFLPNLIAAFFVLVIAYYLGKLVGNIVLRFLSKSRLSRTHNLFFKKLVIWIFLFIGFSLALNVLGLTAASAGLLTGGGITALAVGFLFKDFGQNVLSGVYMAFSRPFDTNDLIASGDFEGIVKRVALTNTHMRMHNGADVFIPNVQIFNEPLVNYTRDGLRRLSFVIGIDYRDDAQKACLFLQNTISTLPKTLEDPPVNVIISGFTSQYVELKAHYWIDAFDEGINVFDKQNEVMEACRKTLIENSYTFSSEVTTANVLSIPEPVEVANTSS